MGLEPPAGKERVLYYLQAHARNDATFSPKTGGKTIFGKRIPNLGIVYLECFYTENMADNVKGNLCCQVSGGI